MKPTEYGRKQLDSKQVKAYLLVFAVTHLHDHGMAPDAVRDSLRIRIAQLLAGTAKNPLATGPEMALNVTEFVRENRDEVESLVERTMNDAIPAAADYGKVAAE